MARKKSLTSQLYRFARDGANVRAATKGYAHGGAPGAVTGEAKRVARRAVYRRTNTVTGGLLRAFGLQGKRR